MAISLKDVWNNFSPDQKRKSMLVATISGVMLVAWGGVALMQANEPTRRASSRPVSHELLTVRDPKSLGIDGLKAEMVLMQKQLREVLESNKDLQARASSKSGPLSTAPVNEQAKPADVPMPMPADMTPEDQAALNKIISAPQKGLTGQNQLGGAGRGKPAFPGGPRVALAPNLAADGLAPDSESPMDQGIRTIGEQDDKSKDVKKDINGEQIVSVSGANAKNNARFVLPAGSIIEGVLVNGLDAPTAAQAKQQPFPVLVRIKHEALLPNRWKTDIRECFLIASGYGDMASERSYMRAEAISCVRDDGSIMESNIDAFATGEDGKNGLRGRLVSKQGSMIAQALMGGFIQGVANIYQPARIPQLTLSTVGNQQQSVARPDPSLALQEGLSGGIQSAGKAVADFYLDMAKNTFPIIEIDAGRKVSFIVSRSANVSTRSAQNQGSNHNQNQNQNQNGFQNTPIGRGINQAMNGNNNNQQYNSNY